MVIILCVPVTSQATVIDYSVTGIRFFTSPHAYVSAEKARHQTLFSQAGTRFIGIDFMVLRSDPGLTGQTPYQVICRGPNGDIVDAAEGVLDWHPGYSGISLRTVFNLGPSPYPGYYTAKVLINGWETGDGSFTIAPRGSKIP